MKAEKWIQMEQKVKAMPIQGKNRLLKVERVLPLQLRWQQKAVEEAPGDTDTSGLDINTALASERETSAGIIDMLRGETVETNKRGGSKGALSEKDNETVVSERTATAMMATDATAMPRQRSEIVLASCLTTISLSTG